MEQDEIQKNLDDMIESILEVDLYYVENKYITRVATGYIRGDSKKNQSIANSEKSLKECLDLLRLHIKYTIFDLEATRRENRMLKNFIREDNNA